MALDRFLDGFYGLRGVMAVSSKKDRLVEDAQKCILRGQFDKAVTIYEQILALEPTAINHHQKLAELLIKCGRNDDARKEFETIGNHFSKSGFYLKAIAVYKQLQKLFPEDFSLSLTLAELNEKHGLVANALSEYKLVYEFHEKSGNRIEALAILNRMQNVDPGNIPIKIKLGEAYFQQRRNAESYAVFSKIISLVLERNDSAMLSRMCARIGQLFPDKPDFMIDILTEQVQQGNAAIAIESLQSLLRNSPRNKRLWDLVVRAYQQMEQPQRVKLAFQHYLKFFPSEPEAMLGLISSVTAEQDLAGALELLDLYEEDIVSSGFLQQLEQVYHSLEKIDPVNIRVLEGLIRVASAAGNESDIRSRTLKLQSLQSVSGGEQQDSASLESPALFEEQSFDYGEADGLPYFGESSSEQGSFPVFGAPEAEFSLEAVSDVEPSDIATPLGADQFPEEEIEIDIEVDFDAPFSLPDQEAVAASARDSGLDSAGDLFDSINIAPRGVKFGNEMDNSDVQSHFDLGQAFKEMGLYDEAINEFHQASQDPLRRVECLIMLCACLRERGELDKAITMLQALSKPGLSEEDSCAVKYELASAYESTGKNEEAKVLLNEINATNPGFRDVSLRLNAASVSESLDFSDEDLEDF